MNYKIVIKVSAKNSIRKNKKKEIYAKRRGLQPGEDTSRHIMCDTILYNV